MNFQSIVSIEPLQLQPTELTKLAAKIGNNTKLNSPNILQEAEKYKTHPPRPLDEIFMDLEQGNLDQITHLEWVYCIYTKKNWDAQHSQEQQLATSQLVWFAATNNDALKQRLCWRLAYYYDGYRNSLAQSLVETFSTLADQEDDDLAIKLLSLLQQREPLLKIAQLAKNEELTPVQLFLAAELPTNLSIINDTLEYVVTTLGAHSLPQETQANWLLSCFQEMEIDQEIRAVDALLNNLSAEIGGQFPDLVEWLQNNYGSRATGSKWKRLSSEGKNALRQWIGAANYRDFQKLVNIILQRLNLPNWEANQLESRKYFWEHYSDRFERIRILLPQSSVNVVGNQLQQDIDVLQEDGSDPTEICIFDFGEWFVVEFFRGSGSETRIFNRHQDPNIEKQLFESSEISVKRLRALGGEVHDHKYLWQVFCEKWLRERRILPNPGTTHFKRRNRNNPNQPHLDPYDFKTGLRYPDAEKRAKREKDLERWRKDIEQLEREAKRYIEREHR